ncbi:MAG TPA: winged helix-turn-helix domain-containing protein [Terriglobales bacterium]|nr:winged helix-turn-helix domain-containing protein [Terriglobales bacterium]
MLPNESRSNSEVVRFAEFEADLRTGELRRDGRLLKVQGKPFQVLSALLVRPGDLVTREELRQSLWPADTFVDFEHGLNTAINKVREALRDSASNPRFIETLPRRGYRFIGAVYSNSVAGVSPASHQTAAGDVDPPSHTSDELPKAPRTAARSLLLLIEFAYLVSYIAALHYLLWVRMLAKFSFGPVQALTVTSGIILWCAMGVPVRFYLLFALAFDYHLLGEKFRRLFPFLLVIDEFWSGMALFLVPTIGLGFGFALFVAAIYSPFAQRTLVRMGYH